MHGISSVVPQMLQWLSIYGMANFGPISKLSVLELPPLAVRAGRTLDGETCPHGPWISRSGSLVRWFIRCEPHQRRVLCHDPIVVDHY